MKLDDCYTCRHCGNPNHLPDKVKAEFLKLQKKVKELEKKLKTNVGGT